MAFSVTHEESPVKFAMNGNSNGRIPMPEARGVLVNAHSTDLEYPHPPPLSARLQEYSPRR
jgi:hypothetical protein